MIVPIGVGVLTGLISALLFASASTGSLLGLLVLFFLSPLPVALSGFGWGWISAAAAAIVATFAIMVMGNARPATFYALGIGGPTAALSYLLLLSRAAGPSIGGRQTVEWYPIGRTITVAAIWAGVLAVIAVLSTASDLEGLKAEIRKTVERLVKAGLPLPPSGGSDSAIGPAEIDAMTAFMAFSMPGMLASIWMTIASINIWLAGHIARFAGKLVRPWPDLSQLTLPKGFPVLFAAALLATFIPGYVGILATGFASAFFFAYLLVGLAILHHVSRRSSVRTLILTTVYLALVLLNPFSGLIVSMIGVAEPFSPLNRRPKGPGGPSAT